MVFILSLQGGDILFIPSHSAKKCKLGLGVSRNVVVLLVLCYVDGCFVRTHPIKFEKVLDLCDRYKMLNCILLGMKYKETS